MSFLSRAVFSAKRAIHSNPQLYKTLYSIATINSDRIASSLLRQRYPSAFGGMWTDLDDYASKAESKGLTASERAVVEQWRTDGFVIFESAVDHALIDQFCDKLDKLPTDYPEGLRIAAPGIDSSALYEPSMVAPHRSTRILDCYYHFGEARDILFSPKIFEFLELVFEKQPILTQSLSFEYGSEQDFHQDTSFVVMTSPLKMAAVWVALEDIEPGTGELLYYPGSHRWGDFLFSGHFKHFDIERDGLAEMDRWHEWREACAAAAGVEPARFAPKKGDILLWHAGLVHGGAKITDESKTRRSLVGHYCPMGVRPLYHFYRPAFRKIHRDGARLYSSGFYR